MDWPFSSRNSRCGSGNHRVEKFEGLPLSWGISPLKRKNRLGSSDRSSEVLLRESGVGILRRRLQPTSQIWTLTSEGLSPLFTIVASSIIIFCCFNIRFKQHILCLLCDDPSLELDPLDSCHGQSPERVQIFWQIVLFLELRSCKHTHPRSIGSGMHSESWKRVRHRCHARCNCNGCTQRGIISAAHRV